MKVTLSSSLASHHRSTNPGNDCAQESPIGRRIHTSLPQLLAMAKENPWWTFTVEELAAITGYSRDAISAAKEHGARFPFGKSRPEWVMEWMAAHPRASLKNPLGEEPSRAERR